MATSFDLDAYFLNKQAKDVDNKLAAVSAASALKKQALEAFSIEAGAKRAQLAAEEEASKNSWVGKLGLEPDSFVANRVNDAASLVSGASRLVGQVATLPINAAAAITTTGLNEDAYSAYNRSLTGVATPEDEALLDTKQTDGLTIKQKFDHAANLRKESRSINDTLDLTKNVEQTNRNRFNKDLGTAFDADWGKVTSGNLGEAAKGFASLLANTGHAILSNPSAVREYIVENAPQLYIGAAGTVGKVAMTASNIGYAADEYQKGIETYAKNNNGQLPPEDERMRMATQAASLAALEHAGDTAGLAFAGVGKRAAIDAAKVSLKQSLKNVGKAAAGDFVTEGATEGAQTYLEGEIVNKPATAKEIFTSGVIGGVSGAGLSGGGRAVAEMAGATPEHQAVKDAEVSDKIKLQTAADSGDVSIYSDPTSKDYHPGKAVEALYKNSLKPDTTEEQHQTNTAKADEIVANLEGKHASAEKNLALSTIAGTKEAIASYEQQLSEMDPADPIRPGVLAAIDVYKANLADKEIKGENPAAIKANREELAKVTLQLEQATKNQTALTMLNTARNDVANLVATADTAINTGAEQTKDAPADVATRPGVGTAESVNKLITLSMTAPHRVSAEQAMQLVNNKANGLTDSQRSYLRAFSEARVAENTLMNIDSVSQQIYQGGGTNIGMSQHRAALRAALTAGDQEAASKTLEVLDKFAQSHQQKAALGNSAEKGAQILRDKTGNWFIADAGQRLKTDAAIRENGGFINNSPDLVEKITKEARALGAMVTAAKAAYELKFNPTEPGVENVKNTPRSVPTKEGQSETKVSETSKEVDQARVPAVDRTGDRNPDTTQKSDVMVPDVKVVEEVAKVAPATPAITEETDIEMEERLQQEKAVLAQQRQDKVADLERRIALLEAVKKCIGG